MGRPRKDAATATKTQSAKLSRPPYAMPLDTIGNVRRELGRLYRASLSGKLDSVEAARLAFILKEVRAALEAESVLPLDTTMSVINFSILSVPPGTQLAEDGKSFIWPDGTPCAAPTEFIPHEPTENWTALPPPASAPSVMNAETAAAIDVPNDGKITVLHPYQRRYSEPGE